MMTRAKAFFDKNIERLISRKFLVFVIATIGVAIGFIDADNWTSIAIAYVGVEGFADLASRWKQIPFSSNIKTVESKTVSTNNGNSNLKPIETKIVKTKTESSTEQMTDESNG